MEEADDIDAMLEARAKGPKSQGDDIDALLNARASPSGHGPIGVRAKPSVPWWKQALMSPVAGLELAAQTVTGAAASIPAGLGYGGAAIGKAFGADVDPSAVQSEWQNYLTWHPKSEIAQKLNAADAALTQKVTAPVVRKYGEATEAVAERSPFAGELMKAAPGAFQAASALVPAYAGMRAAMNRPFVPQGPEPIYSLDEPHPLAEAAKQEGARLEGIKQRATAAGFDLPEGGSGARHAKAAITNQPLANEAARQELMLPDDAPLTPQLLDKARSHYASPAYKAIEQQEAIPLGAAYKAEMESLGDIPAEFSDKLKPPEIGAMISGKEAVNLSRKFRYRANQYDKQAMLSGSPEASDLAELHRGAAEAIEEAVKQHLDSSGNGQLAQDWDNARVYVAKTYSVQNALDGAGNVKVTDLKRQLLKNKPLSGKLEMLANLGAQYPEAFRLTPASGPKPGLVRRATAAVIPHAATAAGAGLGSAIGFPGAGAVAGRAVGESLSNRIVPP